MSDIIQLLPDTVANQIAAGEVIQRPASVIKELVENAVDAGAKNIHVAVVDAGRTSIQVTDDGKGMSETDARLSFERHATSKIRVADDLFNLHTMGFRGEALASIAAVAQVELKTRQQGSDIGTHLTIAGSKFMGQEPCACPEGSNFLIENLFYNVPARRKFLKSNSTELNNIISAFERIVLVYPQIAFTFHSNGSEMYNLRAGKLRQRIVEVFGKRINQDLLPVNVETSVCGISGFVGKPESGRKKGAQQFFFVNGRYMRHPYFSKAVMQAFDRLLPQGEQVPYFIYFDVDPKDIDVNIHPTKTEIKFENEQTIWQILFAAVKDAVGMFNQVSTIDFDTEGKPDIPVFSPDQDAAMPDVQYNPQYNPFSANGGGTGTATHTHTSKIGGGLDDRGLIMPSKAPLQWEQLYSGLEQETAPAADLLFPDVPEEPEEALIAEKSPVHYQYKGRYIMTAVKSGLMIIDQHRAHVRILFEQYMDQLAHRRFHAQKTLFPESLQLTPQEDAMLSQVADDLGTMGFELTPLGGGTYALNAIPEGLEGVDTQALIHDMLASAHDKGTSALQEMNEALALSMARATAIPYGQVLGNEEMENVVNRLFQCSNVNYTPSGKKTLYILPQHDIDQLLG
jgi:DNA mismatch repair protein MutL